MSLSVTSSCSSPHQNFSSGRRLLESQNSLNSVQTRLLLIPHCMAHLCPNFTNFRWCKMLLPELSPDLLNQYLHFRPFLTFIGSLSINESTQQPAYLSSLISYRHSIVCSILLASLFWMFPERKPNLATVPSPLQLHKSGTKYLLPLELHHHSTVSNTILKPIISPFHEIPTNQHPYLKFQFILNAGALLHYNILHDLELQGQSVCSVVCSQIFDFDLRCTEYNFLSVAASCRNGRSVCRLSTKMYAM